MSNLKMGVSVDTKSAITSLRMLDTGLVGIGKAWTNVGMQIAKTTGLIDANSFASTSNTKAMKLLGAKVLLVVGAFALLGKVVLESIRAFAEFENELKKIQALTGSSAVEIATLKDEMLALADGSIYTADEIARATTEITKLGVSAQDAVSVLSQTSALAVGTQEDLVHTTQVTMKVLRGFGGEIENITHVTDVMATAISSSGLDVQTYGAGMQYLASQGDAVGLSIEEVSTQLAYLVNSGQNANRSGRLVSTMYAEMADEGSNFNLILKNNGIELDTVSEKMRWLQENSIDTTQANAMFTSGVARMAVVVSDSSEAMAELTEDMKDVTGASKEMERIGMESMASQWRVIAGQASIVTIQLGEMLAPIGQAFIGTNGMAETMRLFGVLVGTADDEMGILNTTVQGVASVFEGIGFVLNGAIMAVGTLGIVLDGVWQSAMAGIGDIATMMGNLVGMFFAPDKLKSLGDNLVKVLTEPFKVAGDIAKDFFSVLLDPKRWNEFGDLFGNAMARGAEGLDTMVEGAKGYGSEMADAMMDGVGETDIAGMWSDKLDDLVNLWGGTTSSAGEVIGEDLANGITKGLELNLDMGGPDSLPRTWLEEWSSVISEVGNEITATMGNIATIQQNRYQADIDAFKKAEQTKLDSTIMSNRRRQAEQDKIDKAVEEKEKEAKKKQQNWAVSQALINGALGVTDVWANHGANPITAGILSGLVTATTATEIGAIKSQNFANSGIVEGEGGATGGADNITVGAREGEMFLNGRDQKTLFDAIQDGSLSGGGGSPVYIENFSGNSDDMERFENMYRDLQSAGRIR